MVLRTITWTVDEKLNISPQQTQEAGIQGEHEATEVVFRLPASIMEKASLHHYIEYIGSDGVYDVSPGLSTTYDSGSSGPGTTSYKLPRAWTQSGGTATLRLVAEDVSGEKHPVAYSVEARIRFRDRKEESEQERRLLEGPIRQAFVAAEAEAEKAEAAAAEALRQLKIAETGAYAIAVENGFQGTVEEWLVSLRGESGVYVGSGDMPEGYDVQIDPDGQSVTMDDEMSDASEGIPKNKVVKAYVDKEIQTRVSASALSKRMGTFMYAEGTSTSIFKFPVAMTATSGCVVFALFINGSFNWGLYAVGYNKGDGSGCTLTKLAGTVDLTEVKLEDNTLTAISSTPILSYSHLWWVGDVAPL